MYAARLSCLLQHITVTSIYNSSRRTHRHVRLCECARSLILTCARACRLEESLSTDLAAVVTAPAADNAADLVTLVCSDDRSSIEESVTHFWFRCGVAAPAPLRIDENSEEPLSYAWTTFFRQHFL
ncbi:hypothetical protein RR46_14913 [Papilio xuthus]|uniref:Uncharacterized protein n=1 Tax=Papilio xuthus TaxID=66420 RepID=A0A194PFD5_PAPXU|nr:hypothetical protein RR46_14913 [Papilio xuthus]